MLNTMILQTQINPGSAKIVFQSEGTRHELRQIRELRPGSDEIRLHNVCACRPSDKTSGRRMNA